MAKAPAEKPVASPAEIRKDGLRETVESIVIAFILAFLFRTFEAEAFVIPTGSMAPTLMGRHKDLHCEKCGFPYQASASDEVDDKSTKAYPCAYHGVRDREGRVTWKCVKCGDTYTEQVDPDVEKVDPRRRICPSYFIRSTTCPNCRWTMRTTRGPPDQREMTEASYKGDRILVGKFNYEFSDPERFDVVVFKYPEESQINFIKRLIGLPNETLKIQFGNIYTRGNVEGSPYAIARKPAEKVRAALQIVHDNDYILADQLVKQGWPVRWQPADEGWQSDDGGRTYGASAAAGQEAWLRYLHFAPTYEDWHLPAAELAASPRARNPQLIADFTGYNTNFPGQLGRSAAPGTDEGTAGTEILGQHWVGDLALECELEAQSSAGEALLELVEGGLKFQCAIELSSGRATLSIDGDDDFVRTAETAVRGPGTYHLAFANVDDQLLLWVDNELVEFEGGTEYGELPNHSPRRADLAPLGVGARGAKLRVAHLRALRDAYYIVAGREMRDYIVDPRHYSQAQGRTEAERLAYIMSTPEMWEIFEDRGDSPEYRLDEDRFLVLGDNSARSKDSRLWSPHNADAERAYYAVTRDLLIGKAIYIYWPHSFEKLPGTDVPFPFFPNFDRMQFVR